MHKYLGKLSGENNFNKRIFLYAKLVSSNDTIQVLDIKVDRFYHEQGWQYFFFDQMIRIENLKSDTEILVQNVISMKVTPFKRAKIAPS